MSIFISLVMCAIIASLGFALYFMMKRGQSEAVKSKQMAKALTYRIVMSVALFCFVLVAWTLGWIHPTGIRLGQ